MHKFLATLLITLLTLSPPAMAYIDPGSGSAIMSAIVGFFVAIAMVVKTYWYKFKSLFSSSPKANIEEQVEEKRGEQP